MGDVGSARYETALFLPCPTAVVYEETLNLGKFMHYESLCLHQFHFHIHSREGERKQEEILITKNAHREGRPPSMQLITPICRLMGHE